MGCAQVFHSHLSAALQVQHQRLGLGDGRPHSAPALPFLLHVEVATLETVLRRQRRLPLATQSNPGNTVVGLAVAASASLRNNNVGHGEICP